ncbi:MAG: hypothetical protein EXS18_08020 [Verrucomicrobiae bacterium]|nr:hypothetical protein [Verrucomicrobiae bacterium]
MALPSNEMISWLFETYSWLLSNLGGFDAFKKTKLVTPTPEHFPIRKSHDPELAEKLFEIVRAHAGMQNWPCKLQAHDGGRVSHILSKHNMPHSSSEQSAAGTFSVSQDRAVIITYRHDQVNHPVSLIATFAHELSHYLLATIPNEPPGGSDAIEPATDVGAVFMGFGIFQANSAFSFQQFSDGIMQGWSSSRLGYLGELELSYALAIFVSLHQIDPDPVKRHLDTNPKAYFKSSIKDVARSRPGELERLRLIEIHKG